MEWFRCWILGICTVCAITAVLKVITPLTAAGGWVRSAGAFAIVLAVLAPIKKLSADDFEIIDNRYRVELESGYDRLCRENERIEEDIIKEKISAYILRRADELGVECSDVRVEIAQGKPESVMIFSQDASAETRLCDVLGNELGIEHDRQFYR